MASVLSAVLIAPLFLGQAQTGKEIFEVETQALAQRQSIRSGVLVFHEKNFHPAGKLFHDRRLAIWFDGERTRNDKTFNSQHNIEREIRCRNCPDSGTFTEWVRTKDTGLKAGFGYRKMKSADNPSWNEIIDPRYLGMLPDDISSWYRRQLNDIVGRARRRNAALKRGNWKGQECWEVQFESIYDKTTSQAHLWIVPAWGHSVVRIETHFTNNLTDAVESDVSQVPGSTLWFPTHVVYTRTLQGKEQDREETDVELISLNQPIDPKAFRIEGMDVPVNTPVDGVPGDNRMYRWEGQRVVKVDDVPEYLASLDDDVPVAPPVHRKYWLIAASIGLALVALLLSWRVFWRKPNPG